jgi:starch synthase
MLREVRDCEPSNFAAASFRYQALEAMAADLPAVVANWDGYKDAVRDGIDGFRIPTLIGAGLGGDHSTVPNHSKCR